MALAFIKIEADGVEIEVNGETKSTDVSLVIDKGEKFVLSQRNAIILGLALIECAQGEDD